MDNCSFNESLFNIQLKQQQRHYLKHQMSMEMSSGNFFVPRTSNDGKDDFAFHMELNGRELDQYIRLQNEKLIMVLQEYKEHQFGMMLKKIELQASNLLRQKDTEILQMARRTMELEELLTNLEMDKLQWQKVAQENETMVGSLNNTLDEFRENYNINSNNEARDAESCCGGVNMESSEQSRRKMMMVCKGCKFWNSCIVFLPCRHLCSCKKCEANLDNCPVCGTIKKNSIEALIF